uniref:Uncharacterized protein n=2 Tax=Hemiselmis andersenii TaxID=464988 RepID=A0A7S0Y2P6_HEMAN|mmetsp:Transcript_31705/g.73774  ORF Transcript_31705/g.73774 Transcript_31705/m.73774 type:complete len:240 (+) Transcript_31705:142-861(+)
MAGHQWEQFLRSALNPAVARETEQAAGPSNSTAVPVSGGLPAHVFGGAPAMPFLLTAPTAVSFLAGGYPAHAAAAVQPYFPQVPMGYNLASAAVGQPLYTAGYLDAATRPRGRPRGSKDKKKRARRNSKKKAEGEQPEDGSNSDPSPDAKEGSSQQGDAEASEEQPPRRQRGRPMGSKDTIRRLRKSDRDRLMEAFAPPEGSYWVPMFSAGGVAGGSYASTLGISQQNQESASGGMAET